MNPSEEVVKWEEVAARSINGIAEIMEKIKRAPDETPVNVVELKAFMVNTASALMALHLLLNKDVQIGKN